MTEAETILRMIETVDVNDTAKLDEIDARVACYLNTTYQQKFISMESGGRGFQFEYTYQDGKQGKSRHNLTRHYTRSRDALKSIRPEGWELHVYTRCIGNDNGYQWHANAALFSTNDETVKKHVKKLNATSFWSGLMITEELAELYAIIQAIAHERAQEGK